MSSAARIESSAKSLKNKFPTLRTAIWTAAGIQVGPSQQASGARQILNCVVKDLEEDVLQLLLKDDSDWDWCIKTLTDFFRTAVVECGGAEAQVPSLLPGARPVAHQRIDEFFAKQLVMNKNEGLGSTKSASNADNGMVSIDSDAESAPKRRRSRWDDEVHAHEDAALSSCHMPAAPAAKVPPLGWLNELDVRRHIEAGVQSESHHVASSGGDSKVMASLGSASVHVPMVIGDATATTRSGWTEPSLTGAGISSVPSTGGPSRPLRYFVESPETQKYPVEFQTKASLEALCARSQVAAVEACEGRAREETLCIPSDASGGGASTADASLAKSKAMDLEELCRDPGDGCYRSLADHDPATQSGQCAMRRDPHDGMIRTSLPPPVE